MITIEQYVRAQGARLLHTAFLLTGDRHRAEDLVQTALAKLVPRWSAIVAKGDPGAYVRQTLLTTYLSWRRRRGSHEQPSAVLPEPVGAAPDLDLRLVLLDALAQLPPRQRATLVLRYLEDLSEAQTAAILGCEPGTVKSQTSKALRNLRSALSDFGTEVRHGR